MTYSVVQYANTGSGKITVGESGLCRYCQKEKPEVSFSNRAHAIPQFIGNNEIFSKDECNSCNKFFGAGYDDDLSKYLGGRRTVSQMRGRTGIPSYKTHTELSRIDVNKSGMRMLGTEGDDTIHLNEESNTVGIKIRKQPYSPLGVYKSFLKMAIALAPRTLLSPLDVTRQFLMRKDNIRCPCFRPFLIETFIPGPLNNELFTMLLKRSEEVDIPSLMFLLYVSNYCFQIVVPCPELDQKLAGQDVRVPRITHPLEHMNHPYGSSISRKVDLSQLEKVRDQYEIITMHYDRIVPECTDTQ